MKTALQAGEFAEVGRLGHHLKGTIVYLGAEPATEAAQRVAHFSRNPGEPAAVQEAVKALERECAALRAVLNGHPLAIDLASDMTYNQALGHADKQLSTGIQARLFTRRASPGRAHPSCPR